MGSNEFHPRNPGLILHLDDQAVFVARDIEHHAAVATEARASVLCFDVLRRLPVRLERFVVPALQSAFRIGAFGLIPVFDQRTLGNDSHNRPPVFGDCRSPEHRGQSGRQRMAAVDERQDVTPRLADGHLAYCEEWRIHGLSGRRLLCARPSAHALDGFTLSFVWDECLSHESTPVSAGEWRIYSLSSRLTGFARLLCFVPDERCVKGPDRFGNEAPCSPRSIASRSSS